MPRAYEGLGLLFAYACCSANGAQRCRFHRSWEKTPGSQNEKILWNHHVKLHNLEGGLIRGRRLRVGEMHLFTEVKRKRTDTSVSSRVVHSVAVVLVTSEEDTKVRHSVQSCLNQNAWQHCVTPCFTHSSLQKKIWMKKILKKEKQMSVLRRTTGRTDGRHHRVTSRVAPCSSRRD